MTLIEIVVAIGIASLVFTAVAMLTIYTARSFVALGNYDDLDRYSRNALDRMSREIRQTRGVWNFRTNRVVFIDYDGQTNLVYYWDPLALTLTRMKGNTKELLLTNCEYLRFGNYQRNPSNNFNFYPAASRAEMKLIDVSWRCYRKVLGATNNTESVQTAKIVIRN